MFMFVYFGVEMNNECRNFRAVVGVVHFLPSKYTYRKCLFFCSDSSVCHSNCLTTNTKDHERDVFQLRRRLLLSENRCCVTHNHPSIMVVIHNLKLRISPVPLHQCFMSGGSTKEHRQNCLCTQPTRQRKRVMTNNYLRHMAAIGNNGFSLANHCECCEWIRCQAHMQSKCIHKVKYRSGCGRLIHQPSIHKLQKYL